MTENTRLLRSEVQSSLEGSYFNSTIMILTLLCNDFFTFMKRFYDFMVHLRSSEFTAWSWFEASMVMDSWIETSVVMI